MIRFALTAVLALSGSVLLHGAGLSVLPETRPATLAGGGGTAPPLLGDSFSDLAEGMAQAVPANPVQAAATPQQALAPVAPAANALVPLTPDGLATVAAMRPLRAESPPMEAALRPQPRALQPRPDPPAAKATPAKPPAAKGGEKTTRKGVSTGNTSGQTSKAQGQQTSAGTGGAAASASYGATVMRKIARTRKKSTSLRGTALVSFSVAPDGRLAAVSIARSSGHAELDRLGLDHIRRAAPFPAPPSGANTRFSVEFRGR